MRNNRKWELKVFWKDGRITTLTGDQWRMFMAADEAKAIAQTEDHLIDHMKLRTVIDNV